MRAQPDRSVAPRPDSESFRRLSVQKLLQLRRRRVLIAAALLFVAVLVLDLAVGGVAPALYFLPIALLAGLSGVRAGLGASALAFALTALGALWGDAEVSGPAYIAFALLFLVVSVLAVFRDRPLEELRGPIKHAGGALALFILILNAGVSVSSSAGPEVAQYQYQQQAARSEDVNPSQVLERHRADAANTGDEDDLLLVDKLTLAWRAGTVDDAEVIAALRTGDPSSGMRDLYEDRVSDREDRAIEWVVWEQRVHELTEPVAKVIEEVAKKLEEKDKADRELEAERRRRKGRKRSGPS